MNVQVASSSGTLPSSAPVTLDQLPSEILFEIFDRIPFEDLNKTLRSISGTCVRFAEFRHYFLSRRLSNWTDKPGRFIALLAKTNLDPFKIMNLCEYLKKKYANIEDIKFTIPENPQLLTSEELLTEKEKKQLGMLFGVINAVNDIFSNTTWHNYSLWYTQFPICPPSRSEAGLMNVFESLGSVYMKMTHNNKHRNHLPIFLGFEKYLHTSLEVHGGYFGYFGFFELQWLILLKEFSFLQRLRAANMYSQFLPIHWAAICGTVQEIRELGERDVNTGINWPPLFYAAMRGDPEIVKALLDLNANPSYHITSAGVYTPERIKEILYSLAHPFTTTNTTWSPLSIGEVQKIYCNPLTLAVFYGNTDAAWEIMRHRNSSFYDFFDDNRGGRWMHVAEYTGDVRSLSPYILALWNDNIRLIRKVFNSRSFNPSPETLPIIIRNALTAKCSAEMLFTIMEVVHRLSSSWGVETANLELHEVMNYAAKINAERCIELLLNLGYSPNKISLELNQRPLWMKFISPPHLVTPYSLAKTHRIKVLMEKQGGTKLGLLAINVSYVGFMVLMPLFRTELIIFSLMIHFLLLGMIFEKESRRLIDLPLGPRRRH